MDRGLVDSFLVKSAFSLEPLAFEPLLQLNSIQRVLEHDLVDNVRHDLLTQLLKCDLLMRATAVAAARDLG